MKRPGGKVAILGGGMAGLSTAWRLSEPGWQNRFDAITVYQRGWRLGGKGASHRGIHGRIEEHGLHIWLGSYENAFHLLQQCYDEIDRPTTDPKCPVQRWEDALIAAENPGLAELHGGQWLTWLGTHPRDGGTPGQGDDDGRDVSVVGFVERAAQLLDAFAGSLADSTPGGLAMSTSRIAPPARAPEAARAAARAAIATLISLATAEAAPARPVELVDRALLSVRSAIDYESHPEQRRAWLLASLLTAVIRGILADNLITHSAGFRAINDQDFCAWLLSHGAHPDVLTSPMVRGLYDLVFGYRDADPQRPAVAAGLMVFLVGQVLFGYRGALFWKMTAGMGDVVIAPLYQALRQRGVRFEFFHRLDALHLDAPRHAVESISLGRQAALHPAVREYQPLTKVGGLWVFPNAPLADQLDTPVTHQPRLRDLESHFAERSDIAQVTLRRGVDFDHVVLAVSLGMIPTVADELLADRREWREMTQQVHTVATQAFQLWLRPAEHELGWTKTGSTVSAYRRPFETWASMPQTLWAEHWPAEDTPQTVAYFCGSLTAPWPINDAPAAYLEHHDKLVRADALDHVRTNLGLFFPRAFTDGDFDWSLLAGANGQRGAAALDTQHISVNIDPSDRYVQSVPGSDKFRLRPDESGYDNLVLAGDWTDCGMNAGCIEAAVMSGLEAANALLGRGRFHRIRGYYLP